jgi:hypothetical protein
MIEDCDQVGRNGYIRLQLQHMLHSIRKSDFNLTMLFF